MNVLVACECSGTVRDAFSKRGHDAWSCDLKPTERPGNHIIGDAIEAIKSREWDLLIHRLIADHPLERHVLSVLERKQKTIGAAIAAGQEEA